MPKFPDPVVLAQPTIYDLPVLDMVPTTIQSPAPNKIQDTMKKPLLSNPDMERSYHKDTRRYHDDSDEPCCDSCCDGVCSDETLCMCLCCLCMCED
jgi:hypothetical protein